jgi:hypothetical protein
VSEPSLEAGCFWCVECPTDRAPRAHLDLPALEVGAVQVVQRLLRITRVTELNEAKPFGPAVGGGRSSSSSNSTAQHSNSRACQQEGWHQEWINTTS